MLSMTALTWNPSMQETKEWDCLQLEANFGLCGEPQANKTLSIKANQKSKKERRKATMEGEGKGVGQKELLKTAAWSLFLTMSLNMSATACGGNVRAGEVPAGPQHRSWGRSALVISPVCYWWWGSLQLCWRHVHFLVNLPFPSFS